MSKMNQISITQNDCYKRKKRKTRESQLSGYNLSPNHNTGSSMSTKIRNSNFTSFERVTKVWHQTSSTLAPISRAQGEKKKKNIVKGETNVLLASNTQK